jgi:hypothetical protein
MEAGRIQQDVALSVRRAGSRSHISIRLIVGITDASDLEASTMVSNFARDLTFLGRSTAIVGGALLTLGGLYGQAFAQTSPTVAPTALATTTATPLMASTAVPTTMATGTPVPSNMAVGTPAPLPTTAPGNVSPLPTLQSESDLRVALNTLLMRPASDRRVPFRRLT